MAAPVTRTFWCNFFHAWGIWQPIENDLQARRCGRCGLQEHRFRYGGRKV